ncbi:MAG: polysaccharide biosynthesis/export family protein [Moheibacter sp.]
MKIKNYFTFWKVTLLFFAAIMLSSCATREKLVYFQNLPESLEKQLENYSPVIQPDDLLVITISARDFDATKPFNQVNFYYQNQNEVRLQTYLVDAEGYIEYPVLGKIKLGGLTRPEAMSHMKTLLAEYIIDPGVTLQITNFKVTVLGEVSNPGTYTLPNERITILEALGLAGDLTLYGVRNNVLVIRETGEEKTFHRVDLTSDAVFSSPVYFLKQNDVVYVEPNQARTTTSTYSSNYALFISVAGLIVTVISVLTR